MNICIICSLQNKDQCLDLVSRLSAVGNNVSHPFVKQEGSLLKIQRDYIYEIEKSDVVIVIPKNVIDDSVSDITAIAASIGESTSYELAYALRIGKIVLFDVRGLLEDGKR